MHMGEASAGTSSFKRQDPRISFVCRHFSRAPVNNDGSHLPLRAPGTKSDVKETQGRVFQCLRVDSSNEGTGPDFFAGYILMEDDGNYLGDSVK